MMSSFAPGIARRSSMSSRHIVGVLTEGLGGGVQRRVVGVEVAVAGHHGVGPPVEAAALVGVEAHELGDDDQRQVDGEVLDEVELAALGDLVDDLVGQLPHVVAELAHRAGVKPLLISRRWRVCSGSSIAMIDIGAATWVGRPRPRSSAPGGG